MSTQRDPASAQTTVPEPHPEGDAPPPHDEMHDTQVALATAAAAAAEAAAHAAAAERAREPSREPALDLGLDPAPDPHALTSSTAVDPNTYDPLTHWAREDEERRTNPRVPREKTRFTRLAASRRTLYALLAATIGLLVNGFGVFLFIALSDRVSVAQVWYLWVDGLISGIVVVYTLSLVRQLHHALGQ